MKTKYIKFADRNFFKLDEYTDDIPLLTFDDLTNEPDITEVDLFIVNQYRQHEEIGDNSAKYLLSPKDRTIICTDMFVNLPREIKKECADLKDYDGQMYLDWNTAYLVKYKGDKCQLTHVTIIPELTSKEQ